MPSKKPPAKQSPKRSESLHIAAIRGIVGRHHNQPMPLVTVRSVLDRALDDAGTPMESKDNARLREHLERELGLSLR